MAITPPSNSDQLKKNEETMRYRPIGKTGLEVSALSFGCMRLSDDETLNKELISTAIDQGINYFETTRHYLGGRCQHRTAPGLKDKSDGVIVSGKEGINPNTTAYNFRHEIERQLDILGISHFKFFQVGWFGWERVRHLIKRGGVLDALRRAQDEGLVQHIGFTGHDTPENFIKCIETGVFDCITVPYNLVNRRYEPTIKRAGELGVGVVAMCPVGGGMLSGESGKLKDALDMDLPTTEMALRFVLSNPDVSTACSGMNRMEHLEQNVRTVREFDPQEDASFEELTAGLDALRAELGEEFCTGCRYCMPCPEGVNIPRYMEIYRNSRAFGLDEWARDALNNVDEEAHLDNCTECGQCEEACPNDLPIRERLRELAKMQ